MRHLALTILLGLSVCGRAVGQEYTPRTLIAKALPAITDPKIVAAEAANVTDNELVLGVVIDGQARAYPINQLTGPRREIINDELAGTAIAATW